MEPKLCPVCQGTGEKHKGFYQDQSTMCKACIGKGYIHIQTYSPSVVPDWTYRPQPYINPHISPWISPTVWPLPYRWTVTSSGTNVLGNPDTTGSSTSVIN